jgi:enoyl-CoA hydratase/carnithine racemase
MTYEVLNCELQGEVAIVTLNRPEKRNALSRQLRDEIVSCLGELEQNENVKAVIITGSGDSFCAGFDLAEFQSGDMQEIFSHATNYHHKVYNTNKPTIAAVNGPAMAGGMDLAAMCDVRVVATNVTFGQPQVKMGIAAAFDLLRTVVPEPLARELCLTGRKMDAEEAKVCGFVNRIVESEALISAAVQLASDISQSAGSGLMKSQFKASQPDLFE